MGGSFRVELLRLDAAVAGFEAHEFLDEGERDVAGGSVSVFGDDEFGEAFVFFPFLIVVGVVFLAVEEADHVGVLLDGAGFPEVGHAGGAAALFGAPVELGEDDDGDLEFLGDGFEACGDFGDFPFAGAFGLFGFGAHQLEVVDGDELDVFVALFATGFGADVTDGDGWGVVDEEGGVDDLLGCFLNPGEFAFGEVEARFEVGEGELGAGEEETLDNLLGAHLAGEDEGGLFLVEGDVLDDVHHEGGFSHGGAGGDDEHLAGFHAAAHGVEDCVAGGCSLHAALAGEELFDDLDDITDEVLGEEFALDFGAFLDGEDLLFDLVEEAGDVFGFFVGAADGVGAGGDDGAEEELRFDDAEVVVEVSSGGGVGVDVGELGRAADVLEQVSVGKGLGEGDEFDGEVFLVEFEEDLVEGAVGGDVEVFGGEVFLDGVSDEVGGILHHGAEDAALWTDGAGHGTDGARIFIRFELLKAGAAFVVFELLWSIESHRRRGWRGKGSESTCVTLGIGCE